MNASLRNGMIAALVVVGACAATFQPAWTDWTAPTPVDPVLTASLDHVLAEENERLVAENRRITGEFAALQAELADAKRVAAEHCVPVNTSTVVELVETGTTTVVLADRTRIRFHPM